MLQGFALGVFGPKNVLRKWAVQVVTHPSFDLLIGVLIIVSSCVLAATNPRDAGPRKGAPTVNVSTLESFEPDHMRCHEKHASTLFKRDREER